MEAIAASLSCTMEVLIAFETRVYRSTCTDMRALDFKAIGEGESGNAMVDTAPLDKCDNKL